MNLEKKSKMLFKIILKTQRKLVRFKTFIFKQQDANSKDSYQKLLEMSLELDDKFDLKGNRLFYLAMSPKFLELQQTT